MPSLIKQQVTYESILDWKLHWLTCDLNHDFEFKLNTQQSIDDGMKFLSVNSSNFNVMLHKFTIMMGFDLYDSEVLAELETMEKYKTYQDTFRNFFAKTVAAQLKLDKDNLDSAYNTLQNRVKFDLTVDLV